MKCKIVGKQSNHDDVDGASTQNTSSFQRYKRQSFRTAGTAVQAKNAHKDGFFRLFLSTSVPLSQSIVSLFPVSCILFVAKVLPVQTHVFLLNGQMAF